MEPSAVVRLEHPRSGSQILRAAIDEALDLDEVVQAMKRTRMTARDVRTHLTNHHAEFFSNVGEELEEYTRQGQLAEYIAQTIHDVTDPFQKYLRAQVKRPYDPLAQLLSPAFKLLLFAVPEMLEPWHRVARLRWALFQLGVILYWVLLFAVFILPSGLYPFGLLPVWTALPGVVLVSTAVIVLVGGLGLRLVRNVRVRGMPPNSLVEAFNQRVSLGSRLDALVQEDPDYRAATAKLDALGQHIQQRLLEQSVLPTIRTLLNATLRHQKNGAASDPREFLVIGAPGLGEVDDQRFEIETSSMSRLIRLLSQLPGGSIGLSGPRGVGKTTILRSITLDSLEVWKHDKTLRVYLPAPVHYVSVEFIAYLAVKVCSAIVSPTVRAAIRQKVEPEEQPAEKAQSFGERFRHLRSSPSIWPAVGLVLVGALYVLVMIGLADALPDGRLRAFAPPLAPAVLVIVSLALIAVARRRPTGVAASCVQLRVHWWAIAVSVAGAVYFAIGARLWELRMPITIWSSVAIVIALLGLLILQRMRWAAAKKAVQSTDNTELRDQDSGPPAALQSEAQDLLEALTFTQSNLSGSQAKMTTGTSAGIELKGELSHTQQITRARRDMTMPELVAQLRQLIQRATSYGRVLVAIDELDKIDSEGDARRFINDLKAIFGVHRSYFVVAVSQDAMVSFERRGLAIRTEIDSAFDDVIYVSHLTLAETRALLERRVIGLSEPFVQLCYCLSGGLPRDAIRSMRNIVNAGLAAAGRRVLISEIAETVLIDEMARYATATLSHSDSVGQPWPPELFHALAAIRTRSRHPGKFRTLAAEVSTQPGSAPEPPEVARLRWELQVLLRFYAETFRFFATDSYPGTSASERLEQLAQARRDLAQNLSFAAHGIDDTPIASKPGAAMPSPDPQALAPRAVFDP